MRIVQNPFLSTPDNRNGRKIRIEWRDGIWNGLDLVCVLFGLSNSRTRFQPDFASHPASPKPILFEPTSHKSKEDTTQNGEMEYEMGLIPFV
jgi:hypothetical protein